MSDEERAPTVTAGAAAGLAGFVAFLVMHHAWIAPIWFIAPVGLVMAAGGGAIVGTAYAELLPGLPRRPMRSLVVAVGMGLILLPAIVAAELYGPIFAMGGNGGGTLVVGTGEAIAAFVAGLFGTAALSGALLGAAIGRSRRAVVWTALAGVALAVGPGHNIPMLGATPAVAKELTILAIVAAVSALVLVEGHARQARKVARVPVG